MRKLLLLCLCFMLLLLPIAKALQKEAQWTLLVYMVGSDLESHSGLASADLGELQKALAARDDINVVVCLGGAQTWQLDLAGHLNGNTGFFTLNVDGLTPLSQPYNQSMGEAQTLQALLELAPAARHTGLILWDHGSGPLIGFGLDENHDNDILTMAEMTAALQNAGKHFDFIGFDACLMGTLETATQLEPYTERLVASEDVEPGTGWSYRFVTELSEDVDASLMRIADVYYEDLLAMCGNDPIMMPVVSLAVYDLTRNDALISSMNVLFENVTDMIDLGGFSTLSVARAGIRTISDSVIDSMVDLDVLIKRLEMFYPEETNAARKELQSWVLHKTGNVQQNIGVSIFFPNSASFKSTIDYIYSLCPSEGFGNMLKRFCSYLGTAPVSLAPPVIEQTVTSPYVTLSDAQVDSYASGKFIVLATPHDKKDIGYRILTTTPATLTGTIAYPDELDMAVYGVDDKTGASSLLTMFEKDRTEESNRYYAFGSLQARDCYQKEVLVSVDLTAVIDREYNRGSFISAVRSDVPQPGKEDISPKDWGVLSLKGSFLLPTSVDGQLLPAYQWRRTGSFCITEFDMSKPFHLERRPWDAGNNDIYLQFVMQDVYGNIIAGEPTLMVEGKSEEPQTVQPDAMSLYFDWNMSDTLVLYSKNGIIITLAPTEYFGEYTTDLLLQIQNNRSDNVWLEAKTCAINGINSSIGFHSTNCKSHTTENRFISPQEPMMRMESITDIKTLDMSFMIANELLQVHLNTSGWKTPSYRDKSKAFSVDAHILYEDDNAAIWVSDCVWNSYDYNINFGIILENRTDKKYEIRVNEAYANNMMLDFEAHAFDTLYPGGRSYIPVTVSKKCLERIVGQVTEIGVLIKATASERGYADMDFPWLSWEVYPINQSGYPICHTDNLIFSPQGVTLDDTTYGGKTFTIHVDVANRTKETLYFLSDTATINDWLVKEYYDYEHCILPGKTLMWDVKMTKLPQELFDSLTKKEPWTTTLTYRLYRAVEGNTEQVANSSITLNSNKK